MLRRKGFDVLPHDSNQVAEILDWGSVKPTHLSAPLIVGGDVSRLDDFTLGLLSNDEVTSVDQDPLGSAAGIIWRNGSREIWARPLSEGTHAVGLVNVGKDAMPISVHWHDVGISGPQKVRDLWLHQDMGSFDDKYSVEVPAHGCVLLKIGP